MSGDNNGATFSPSAIDPKTRARSYSASAYLWPHIGRKNLVVLANATATKVNLSENYKGLYEATGVNFFSRGKNYTVNAAREVILSAGTVNTPQLLELSGIGQPEILKKFDIPVKINLPGVGENLQGKEPDNRIGSERSLICYSRSPVHHERLPPQARKSDTRSLETKCDFRCRATRPVARRKTFSRRFRCGWHRLQCTRLLL